MIEALKSTWLYGSTFCSVEVASQDDEYIYFGVSAKKKADEFGSIDSFKADSLATCSEHIQKTKHCILTINTNQVLLKESVLSNDDTQIISEAFPSISQSEFYCEILKTSTKSFVAICRKEVVDNIISSFRKKGIQVVGFRLGLLGVSNILEASDYSNLLVGGHELEINDNEISQIHSKEIVETKNYSFEDVSVDSNHVIALAGLFNYFNNIVSEHSIEIKNSELRNYHSQSVFFKKGVMVAIGILLVALLVNTLFFSHYHSQFQELKESSEILEGQRERFKIRTAEVEAKERIVQDLLATGNSKSSFYLNSIVSSKPNSIQFQELIYQPLSRAIRPEKSIEYLKNNILIEGEITTKSEFSDWIAKLEGFDWVQNVVVDSYSQSNAARSNFIVSLKIDLDETRN